MTTLQRLNEIFCDVFDDDLEIDRSTTAADVDGWDSVMHVNLVLHVEQAFGVRFSSAEVASLENVGQLADLVEAKV